MQPSALPDVLEPLAIVGFSIEFPDDATTSEAFWQMINEKRCVSKTIPKDRFNVESFYHPDGTRTNSIPLHNAHFIERDIGAFDAPFFSLTPTEAFSMDPQHRGLMECAYHALENAGIPLERIANTKTGVFCGSFTDDYRISTYKDVTVMPKHSATGLGQNFTANRLSWAFNLKGPSLQIDTACSSSLIALDVASQSLRSGDSDMALIGGCNIMSSVETIMALSSMGFLSPDGRCYSFDERGNGYARGEGFGVLVVKRLCDATRDGDLIRAVVRSTGSNQNGRSRSITQTSKADQVELIRDTYRKAGLDPSVTRFVEAHGTGTQVGDPAEASAIAEVFGNFRTAEEPIYIGAVKSNIGHLEGASGIAGIVKTILALERGVIPPNANFEKPNPRIRIAEGHLHFPTTSTPWPISSYIRRASINSFGFGGSNAHVVLDDAYSFLSARGIQGHHLTDPTPSMQNGYIHVDIEDERAAVPYVLPFSGLNENAIKRVTAAYQSYFEQTSEDPLGLASLAHTLSSRRTNHQTRVFAIATLPEELQMLPELLTRPVRSSSRLGLGFVFTGQGAQYAGMGKELFHFPVFRDTFLRVEAAMKQVGCRWSLFEELFQREDQSRINSPEFSQPLCTALQISLFHFLKKCGLNPGTVVGHSSGEIAAAYAVGALSLESACRVAYSRGKLTAQLCSSTTREKGGMLAVGLSEAQVQSYIARLNLNTHDQVLAGCINSPKSVTVTGNLDQILQLKSLLDSEDVFNRLLKVDVAYHSPHMSPIAAQYAADLRNITPGKCTDTSMVSSVTGKVISHAELCRPEYWVRNLVSPVKFSDAVSAVANARPVSMSTKSVASRLPSTYHLVELGPHSTLQGPIRDILSQSTRGKDISYYSAVKRKTDPVQNLLSTVGALWCHGYSVDFYPANHGGIASERNAIKPLTDLPKYPFDHSQSYLHKTRLHDDLLHREGQSLDLLGAPVIGFSPLEPAWRKVIRISEMPWVEDHQVNGSILYPAAGMLVMAIEAVNLMVPKDTPIQGFNIKEAYFDHSLAIPNNDVGLETQLHLKPLRTGSSKTAHAFDFSLCSFVDGTWVRNSHGTISFELPAQDIIQPNATPHGEFHEQYKWSFCNKIVGSQEVYSHFRNSGYQYGSEFQSLSNILHDDQGRCVADVGLFRWSEKEDSSCHQDHVIHPTSLDVLAQLALLGLTNGCQEIPTTTLPTSTRNLFIAAQGLSHPSSTFVRAYSETKHRGERHNEFSITAIDPESGRVLLQWDCLETTNIGSSDIEEDEKAKLQLCYHFDLKPDISLLDGNDLHSWCGASENHERIQFRQDFEKYMIGTFVNVLQVLEGYNVEDCKSWHQNYVAWMREKVSEYSSRTPETEVEILKDSVHVESLRNRIESSGLEGKFYAEVGPNIVGVIKGEVDPLSILFETGLAKGLYQDLNARLSPSLPRLLDLTAHKNPGMKILEIGAGTGGTSSVVIQSLVHGSTARFSQYDFTDISASFFESARSMFGDTAKYGKAATKMNFKVLNIENEPAEQGFEPGSYDLIVAANVLHATQSLTNTLKNTRSLLKPGGKLVFVELTHNTHQGGFAMGLLPGWWLSAEDYRKGGPCIPEDRWHDVLSSTGFSGVDLILKDFEDVECHEQSILVSTALEDNNGVSAPATTVIVIESESELQTTVAGQLQEVLDGSAVAHLSSIAPETVRDKFCISLLDLDTARQSLVSMNEEFLSKLNIMTQDSSGLLWVSSPSSIPEDKSRTGLVEGFRRVLTSENDDLRFITLALEHHENTADIVKNVRTVFEKSVVRSAGILEEEYTEKNGALCVKRMSEANEVNDHLSKHTSNPVVEEHVFGDVSSLRLEFKTPGVLDSMRFMDDPRVCDLEPEQVEIEVRAAGLNFRDCLIALGRMKDPMKSIGFEVAGVVARTGEKAAFNVGDRVYGLVPTGCFSTFAVTHALLLAHIPDTLSFTEAAGLATGLVTAYHSLVRVANLQPDETVLIHSAAGSTGQVALQIAQSIGSTIYATVGTEEKKQLLMTQYNIPEERIFCSRTTAFASHIKRLTHNKGVDVILNSLSDDKLLATWELIAPFGRMVEIGKKDIFANSKLPMLPFAKNATYSVVDIFAMSTDRPEMIKALFQQGKELIAQGKVFPAQPLNVYGVGNVEEAFRYMQSGLNVGKITIEMRKEERVQALVRSKPTWEFDPDASYLIAGGFGGIARSTARWMAGRGARNLILLSRSGARPGKSLELVADLEKEGVRVAAPICDVSDGTALREALDWCIENGMPPVKGCIQGSMVLQDALFKNMTVQEWNTVTNPRVQGTWNLHTMLPSGMDFFVVFSSVAGIVGSAGQANYAASNTYLDAFARHRLSVGEKATSFNLGWMESEGYVAENKERARAWMTPGCWIPVTQPELFALLDHYCDPKAQVDERAAQVLIGLGPPAMVRAKGIADLPPFFERPLFQGLHAMQLDEDEAGGATSADGKEDDFASLAKTAQTVEEASEYVVQALIRRVAKAMAISSVEIDPRKPLHTYGVDSLLAIELRTWFKKYFGFDIAVFNLLGAKDFVAVAEKALKGAAGASNLNGEVVAV